jgi:hypothetical protein
LNFCLGTYKLEFRPYGVNLSNARARKKSALKNTLQRFLYPRDFITFVVCLDHRLNMEVDLQSLFGLHVMCTDALIG